ncbi:MAG TPA: LapA family protein [bacterium]|nr:LapA family protein [bacterium]
MKRLIFAVLMAFIFFLLLNFVYCNLDAETFGYRVVFKFDIPHLIALRSTPISLGFVLLLTFCTGMVMVALLEALPSFFKTLEIRSKNKKIRQLERELSVVRGLQEMGGNSRPANPAPPSENGVSS